MDALRLVSWRKLIGGCALLTTHVVIAIESVPSSHPCSTAQVCFLQEVQQTPDLTSIRPLSLYRLRWSVDTKMLVHSCWLSGLLFIVLAMAVAFPPAGLKPRYFIFFFILWRPTSSTPLMPSGTARPTGSGVPKYYVV